MQKKMKIEIIASLFTIMSGLFTVVYTQGSYDIWDLLMGGFVIYVCWGYRKEFSKDNRAFQISRIGISIAGLVVLMALISIYDVTIPKRIDEKFSINIFEGSFWIFMILFVVSFFIYKQEKCANNHG